MGAMVGQGQVPGGEGRGDCAGIVAGFGADGSGLGAAVPERPAGVWAGASIQPALNSSSVCGGGRGGAMGGGSSRGR